MPSYSYSKVLVWDNLGGSVKVARNQRVTVTDPATGAVAAGLTQKGQPVSYVTSDGDGHVTFASTMGLVRLTSQRGFWEDVESPDLRSGAAQAATDAAASALAAQTAVSLVNAPADTVMATVISGAGSKTQAALSAIYEPVAGEVFIPAKTLLPDPASGPSDVSASGVPVKSFPRTLRVLDSFNRADSAATLGSTETGQAWTVTGTWGIAGNAAYNPTAVSGNRATVPVGVTDMQVSVLVNVLPGTGQAQVLGRFVDASNYVAGVVIPSGAVLIVEVNAGVFTTRGTSAAGAVTAGAKLALRVVGTAATLLVNDVEILAYASITVTGGTSAGMRNGGDTTGAFRFDDFRVGLDPKASAIVRVPDAWAAFDVALLYTNPTTATGDARFTYGERFLSLTGAANLPPVNSANGVAVGVAYRTIQEILLSTNRPVGAGRTLVLEIARTNAHASDTLNAAVALIGVVLRESV